MAHRLVLIVVVLLGLAIAACGGIEQAALGTAVHRIHQVSENVLPKDAASQVADARQALEGCWTLTQAAMYLGVAVVIVATAGLYLHDKRIPGPASPPPAT